MTDQVLETTVEDFNWDEFTKEADQMISEGGRTYAKATIDYGYMVYATGHNAAPGTDSSFFPLKGKSDVVGMAKAKAFLAKVNKMLVSQDPAAKLKRLNSAFRLIVYVDGAIKKGEPVTWQKDRVEVYPNRTWVETSFTKDTFAPSLQANHLTPGTTFYAAFSSPLNPDGKPWEEKVNGVGTGKMIAARGFKVEKLFPTQEAMQEAALADSPAGAVVTENPPGLTDELVGLGYDASSWETLSNDLRNAVGTLKAGKVYEDRIQKFSGEWGIPVENLKLILAA